jgi:signal transduction histidine kinase
MRHLTELLEDGVVTSEEARGEYYSLLSQETRRLHRLVEALLDFARMEAGRYHFRFEPTDPGQFAADVVEEFKRERLANEFVVELDASAGLVCRIDRESLTLAIWNLLENAVKYSGQCRTIRVAVERRGPRGDQRPRRRPGCRAARAEGDSRSSCAAIRPGQRDERRWLGLALVRRIVRGYGGAIEVES